MLIEFLSDSKTQATPMTKITVSAAGGAMPKIDRAALMPGPGRSSARPTITRRSSSPTSAAVASPGLSEGVGRSPRGRPRCRAIADRQGRAHRNTPKADRTRRLHRQRTPLERDDRRLSRRNPPTASSLKGKSPTAHKTSLPGEPVRSRSSLNPGMNR